MPTNTNLERLHEAGVSIWLDTLSRELLDSGGAAQSWRGAALHPASQQSAQMERPRPEHHASR